MRPPRNVAVRIVPAIPSPSAGRRVFRTDHHRGLITLDKGSILYCPNLGCDSGESDGKRFAADLEDISVKDVRLAYEVCHKKRTRVAVNFKGVPICSTFSPCITMIRSDMVSASPWSWVTYRHVTSRCFWILRISVRMWILSLASRLERGSSMSSTRGCSTSTLASATRWLLSSGKLVREPFFRLSEADKVKAFPYLSPDLLSPVTLHSQPIGDILKNAHVRKEGVVLEDETDIPPVHRNIGDIPAVNGDNAGGRDLESSHHAGVVVFPHPDGPFGM